MEPHSNSSVLLRLTEVSRCPCFAQMERSAYLVLTTWAYSMTTWPYQITARDSRLTPNHLIVALIFLSALHHHTAKR